MFPHERSLVQRLAGEPFALIGVNSDTDRDEIAKRSAKENVTWRSFWNGPTGTKGPISAAWNVRGWPTIYILDGQGVIRYRSEGGREKEIDEVLEKLLAEAKSTPK